MSRKQAMQHEAEYAAVRAALWAEYVRATAAERAKYERIRAAARGRSELVKAAAEAEAEFALIDEPAWLNFVRAIVDAACRDRPAPWGRADDSETPVRHIPDIEETP